MADFFGGNPMQATQAVGVDPQALELQRKRQLANLLTQQALTQQPQGQMVSGHYVAPSWTQHLGNLANLYVGQQMQEQADKEQVALAKQLRERNALEAQGIIEALSGKQGETVYGAGQEGPTKEVVGAVAPNPQLALSRALSAEGTAGQAMLPSIMKQVMPEEYTLNEGQVRVKQMPDGTTKVIASGGEKLHSVGSNLVTSSGKVVYSAPEGGQVVDTQNGFVIVNPKTKAVTPLTDASGKPLMSAKGLTAEEGKATNYALSMTNASNEMKTLEQAGFNPSSFKSQSGLGAAGTTTGNILVSKQTQQYKQAMDNFANAYLRFQSGANMAEHEIQRNLKNMMPALGDSSEVLAQKARARDVAIKGIMVAAGPGASKVPSMQEIIQTPKVVDFNSLK